MKKPWIILLCCFLLAAVMCLSVSWPRRPGQMTGPGGIPTFPTRPTESGDTSGTEPVREAAVRLYVCHLDDSEKLEILARQYQDLTGISCQIVTGNLQALMESQEAPTIFCVHSQREATQWADRTVDLTGSAVLEALLSRDFALEMDGKPLGIPMGVDCYGLIYNAALLAQAGYTRSDITDFASLQAIAQYITQDRKVLGFDAFCQPNLEETALTEYLMGISRDSDEIRGFFDLYISNDTATGDPLEQFVAGEVVFYVGGVWEYEQIAALGLSNLDMLPLYTPAGGAFQCIVDGYWAVNAAADANEVVASQDFLGWMVTAGENGTAPADSFDTLLPYADTNGAGTAFDRLLRKYLAGESLSVRWEIAEDLTQRDISNLTVALSRYVKESTDDNWAVITLLMR